LIWLKGWFFAFGGGVVLVVVLPTAFGVFLLVGLLVFPLCGGTLIDQ
jgi:hypothetical protein